MQKTGYILCNFFALIGMMATIMPINAMEGRFEEARTIWEAVGDGPALRNIGGMYFTGVFGSQDPETASGYFEQAAAQNDSEAMLSLGHMYADGIGVTVDANRAEDWFWQAADLGLPAGQFMVARTILERGGLDTDIQIALDHLNLSAQALEPRALMLIGDLLRSGTFVDQDIEKAVAFYASSAENGLAEAQRVLGDIYLFAELGPPDIDQAIQHYLSAAENGSSQAMYALAYLFYSDPGADDVLLQTAFRQAQTASYAWDEKAQLLLGRMYLDGRATPKDDAQAYFWLDLATSAGVVEAHHLRALAHAGIGDEKAADMHASARQWFAENHTNSHMHRLIGHGQHDFR